MALGSLSKLVVHGLAWGAMFIVVSAILRGPIDFCSEHGVLAAYFFDEIATGFPSHRSLILLCLLLSEPFSLEPCHKMVSLSYSSFAH